MEQQIQIRDFEIKDVNACAKISSQMPLLQKYGITEERATEILEEHLNEANRFMYMAEVDGKFAGLVDVVEKGAFALSPYVHQMLVSPEFARRGIGKKLMEFAEVKHKRKYGISLLVNENNEGAITFYNKLGYRQVGKIDGFVRPDQNELIFFKSS